MSTPAVWQVGGLAPLFQGPSLPADLLTIIATDTGHIDFGPKFTLDEGPLTFSNNGDVPVGIDLSVLAATGRYQWTGAVTPGTYHMQTRGLGIDVPPSYAAYAWTLQVNPGAAVPVPVFTGPINNQITSMDATFDSSVFGSGYTSLSYTPPGGVAVPGITFDVGTGIYTIDISVTGFGVFGPFETNYINASGTVSSNPFTYTVFNANPILPVQLETIGRGIGRGIMGGV